MFSIRVICLVSFHYLRRRRLRRFYANRGEETKFRVLQPALPPSPARPSTLFIPVFGSGFPEHVSYCSCTSCPFLYYRRSLYIFLPPFLALCLSRSFFLSSPRSFSLSLSFVLSFYLWPGWSSCRVVLLLLRIRDEDPHYHFPRVSFFGTRRINIIHNSFHFFGVH